MNEPVAGAAELLRIFVGESDRVDGMALSERLVRQARDAGLAGATVLRGHMGFGAGSHLRTARVLDLAGDLPLVIEIVDRHDRLDAFMLALTPLLDRAGCGAMVTREAVTVVHYRTARDQRN